MTAEAARRGTAVADKAERPVDIDRAIMINRVTGRTLCRHIVRKGPSFSRIVRVMRIGVRRHFRMTGGAGGLTDTPLQGNRVVMTIHIRAGSGGRVIALGKCRTLRVAAVVAAACLTDGAILHLDIAIAVSKIDRCFGTRGHVAIVAGVSTMNSVIANHRTGETITRAIDRRIVVATTTVGDDIGRAGSIDGDVGIGTAIDRPGTVVDAVEGPHPPLIAGRIGQRGTGHGCHVATGDKTTREIRRTGITAGVIDNLNLQLNVIGIKIKNGRLDLDRGLVGRAPLRDQGDRVNLVLIMIDRSIRSCVDRQTDGHIRIRTAVNGPDAVIGPVIGPRPPLVIYQVSQPGTVDCRHTAAADETTGEVWSAGVAAGVIDNLDLQLDIIGISITHCRLDLDDRLVSASPLRDQSDAIILVLIMVCRGVGRSIRCTGCLVGKGVSRRQGIARQVGHRGGDIHIVNRVKRLPAGGKDRLAARTVGKSPTGAARGNAAGIDRRAIDVLGEVDRHVRINGDSGRAVGRRGWR